VVILDKTICFDLEGPISPQDNAFEVMGLIPQGHDVFSLLSTYDDELALEEKEGYEPGDTLKLIIPFLLAHDIKNNDIVEVSEKAGLIKGIEEVISALKKDGWKVFIISTSYQQHAHNIAQKVGVASKNVYCTKLDLDGLRQGIPTDCIEEIKEFEAKILSIRDDASELKKLFDEFYWSMDQKSPLSLVMNEVSVCGGARKVSALKDAAQKTATPLSKMVTVGDSITDYKMLGLVRQAGGLAIAFNSNNYALPYANVGLASKTMTPLTEIVSAFSDGGMKAVMSLQEGWDNTSEPYVHLLEGKVSEDIIRVHKEMRSYCRGRAAKLG